MLKKVGVRAFLVIAGAAALGACASEEELKAKYRAEKNEECIAALEQRPAAAVLDAQRFCGCVLDRQMAGKSYDELQKLTPSPAEKQEWGVRCADASLRPDALKTPAAPPPAPVKGGAEAAKEAPKEGR